MVPPGPSFLTRLAGLLDDLAGQGSRRRGSNAEEDTADDNVRPTRRVAGLLREVALDVVSSAMSDAKPGAAPANELTEDDADDLLADIESSLGAEGLQKLALGVLRLVFHEVAHSAALLRRRRDSSPTSDAGTSSAVVAASGAIPAAGVSVNRNVMSLFQSARNVHIRPIVAANAATAGSTSSGGTESTASRKYPWLTSRGAETTTATDSTASILIRSALATSHANIGDEDEAGFVTINQYVLLQEIGAGSQGKVFLAMDTEENEMRAVKEVVRPQAAFSVRARLENARQKTQLKREVAIMKRCRHKAVVSLHEVIDDPEQDRLYMVMQYVDHGPISRVAELNWEPVDPMRLFDYARQLSAGLMYIHQRKIAHRDIKPDNLLRDKKDNVFIADFGVSALVAPPNEAGSPNAKDLALGVSGQHESSSSAFTPARQAHQGTIAFQAPELLDSGIADEEKDYFKADVWSFGLSLYVMLYGRLPFDLNHAMAYIESIVREDVRFPTHPAEERPSEPSSRPASTATATATPGNSGTPPTIVGGDHNRTESNLDITSGVGSPLAMPNVTRTEPSTCMSASDVTAASTSVEASGATAPSPTGLAGGTPTASSVKLRRRQSVGFTHSAVAGAAAAASAPASASAGGLHPSASSESGLGSLLIARQDSTEAFAIRQWRKVLTACLNRDPKQRLNAAQLHRLVKSVTREIERRIDEDVAEQSHMLDADHSRQRRASILGAADEDAAITMLRDNATLMPPHPPEQHVPAEHRRGVSPRRHLAPEDAV